MNQPTNHRDVHRLCLPFNRDLVLLRSHQCSQFHSRRFSHRDHRLRNHPVFLRSSQVPILQYSHLVSHVYAPLVNLLVSRPSILPNDLRCSHLRALHSYHRTNHQGLQLASHR
jgi:hypothetical protein